MATAYKVLGQSFPAASTLTTIYTVPSAKYAIIPNIIVCNLGAYATTIRVAVRPAGAAISNLHYNVYDMTIQPQETIPLPFTISMGATDKLDVLSLSGLVSFSAYGTEIDV